MNPENDRYPGSVSHHRWWICGLLFAATALSFLDRQVLSVLAPVITKQLGMSSADYAKVTTAFLVSYALMFLVGGRVMDVLGTRMGMGLSVGIWSVASSLHALVRNALQLGACRLMLGVGEGGCFPGAAKGVAEWFPARERALAMGIAIGGSSLGAVVAPPMTVLLSEYVGWRGVFLVTGLIGIVWVALWFAFFPPQNRVAQTNEASATDSPRPSLLSLLARLDVWGFAMVRFLVDPVFYFYMFWIPKYLNHERGASLTDIGKVTWIPFLALGISNIAGGWASDRLVRSGIATDSARKWIMAAAAVVTISSSFAVRVGSVTMAVMMMSLLMFAHGFWITNYVTLISDRFPKSAVATVMGFAGAVGAAGGMMANTAIGWTVDKFTYAPVWLASGFMYPLAFAVLLMTVGRGGREGRHNFRIKE